MKSITLPPCEMLSSDDRVVIMLPPILQVRQAVAHFFEDSRARGVKRWPVRFELPRRRISTGRRSLNNRIHGHCQTIMLWAAQHGGQEAGLDEWVFFMKYRAIPSGYPAVKMKTPEGFMLVPKSLADVDMSAGLLVEKQIAAFSIEHGIPLPEYRKDGSIYYVVGGAS